MARVKEVIIISYVVLTSSERNSPPPPDPGPAPFPPTPERPAVGSRLQFDANRSNLGYRCELRRSQAAHSKSTIQTPFSVMLYTQGTPFTEPGYLNSIDQSNESAVRQHQHTNTNTTKLQTVWPEFMSFAETTLRTGFGAVNWLLVSFSSVPSLKIQ